VTLHRPALVDGPLLAETVDALRSLAERLTVVFPMHPRTARALKRRGLSLVSRGIRVLEPLGYLEFLSLLSGCAAAVTDSGGIQEETTYLGIPCFTLRDNTERPVTIGIGTNTLLGLAPERIAAVPGLIEAAGERAAGVPDGWDGRAAVRIVDILAGYSPDAYANDGRLASTGRVTHE
jgi:UDP-N-acetylglucosamine 2-epimerase (non-hydrolysing)